VIVLLHPAPAYGAVERYVESIARALREETVLLHTGVEQFESLPVRSIRIEPSVVGIARFLRASRPRLVHVTDVWPQALVAARLARVPRILVTHHTPELPRQDSLAGRFWQRLGWATRPEVIYTSEVDRERDGRAPSHVVPLGIDVKRFASGRPAFDKRDGRRLVGNVARLAEQKDHRTLLEAAALVPEADFVIAGDGELRGELERTAGPNVRFLGPRTDVPEILASLDVFAFPSLFEGLCLAVIEAQTAGVPVVATAVGGIKETVVDRETGLLVPPRDPEALAAAIRRLLDHPGEAARLAAEARRRAVERYSEEKMVTGTLALYG
jgi:glycosyltransferase involved in cell wall biosynthesis